MSSQSPELSGQRHEAALSGREPVLSQTARRLLADRQGAYLAGNLNALVEMMTAHQRRRFRLWTENIVKSKLREIRPIFDDLFYTPQDQHDLDMFFTGEGLSNVRYLGMALARRHRNTFPMPSSEIVEPIHLATHALYLVAFPAISSHPNAATDHTGVRRLGSVIKLLMVAQSRFRGVRINSQFIHSVVKRALLRAAYTILRERL